MNNKIENGNVLSLSQALELIKKWECEKFKNENVNLAELARLTKISREKLRRLKKNCLQKTEHGNKGKTSSLNVFSGYEAVLNNFLKSNLKNAQVCFERLKELGYEGSLTSVKVYISNHKNLTPSPRQIVSLQGNRGRRYSTEPGQCYQMDWGFVDVLAENGEIIWVACFIMICHHCGQRAALHRIFPECKAGKSFHRNDSCV